MHSNSLDSKIVFVSGGVISGLGKGVTTAALAKLMQARGHNVSVIKADMYLNVDAGTMNPLEHGEVFVTQDGIETDQDLGNYERFLNKDLTRDNYITMGQIYQTVLEKERSLAYGGKCVEGHVHIPEEIISRILKVAQEGKTDILFVEVGGTVGEYQNVMFYESIRRLKQKFPKDVALVHLVYLLLPSFLGELKSKPAQTSIYELYKLGLQPDFVVCRSDQPIDEKRKNTIAFNTGIPLQHIISAPNVDNIYKVPLVLAEQQMPEKLEEVLGVQPDALGEGMQAWEEMLARADDAKDEVEIAIVGKYFNSGDYSLEDSYVCVLEAIKHAGYALKVKPKITWFNSEDFEGEDAKEKLAQLKDFAGIIVPQGWGSRGVEGKIKTVQFARENKIPYLGLCFGMQMAVIEYARHVLGLQQANSEEVNPGTPDPVIHIMPEQRKLLENGEYGGTIRLGSWPCLLKQGSRLEGIYRDTRNYPMEETPKGLIVQERHRHRYEVNEAYKRRLEEAGLIISGTSPDGKLAEAIELPQEAHPFFIATQFHPEYESRPLRPHPIFVEFLKASKDKGK